MAAVRVLTAVIATITAAVSVVFLPGVALAHSPTLQSDAEASAVVGTYADLILADRPSSYWRLGDSSGTMAITDEMRTRSAYREGGVMPGAPGALPNDINAAMHFDGRPCSGVVLEDRADAIRLGAFSVDAWIKPDAPGIVMRLRWYGFALRVDEHGYLVAEAYDGARNLTKVVVGTDLRGEWHHVAMTADAGRVELYVDGHRHPYDAEGGDQGLKLVPGFYGGGDQLTLGRDGSACNGVVPSIRGSIDEVALYDRVLPGSVIKAHADATAGRSQAGGRYVALGDSFGSGEGAAEDTFLPGTSAPDPELNGKATTGCHRSSTSWAYHVKHAVQDMTAPLEQFSFVACSGGVTNDLYGSNARYELSTGAVEAPQLDAVTTDTRLVTLSMGGNDVGFATIVANCVSYPASPGGYGCSAPGKLSYETAQEGLGELRQGLDTRSRSDGRMTTPLAAVYTDIARRMEQGVIAVTGYPRLFDERRSSYRNFAQGASLNLSNRYCELGSVRGTVPIKLRYDDALWMNSVATRANLTIEASVRNANEYLSSLSSKVRVVFVDVDKAFTYHRLCSGDRWLNGVELAYPVADPRKARQKQTSVHPNLEGQRAYAAAVLEKLRAESVIP